MADNTRLEYLRALLNQKAEQQANGNNLVNPSVDNNIDTLAYNDTIFGGATRNVAPNLNRNVSRDGTNPMQEVDGFIDEIGKKFYPSAYNVINDEQTRNWWQRTMDTINAISYNITGGFLNFFDSIGDLALNVANEIGGGDVEWAKNVRDYNWQDYVNNVLNASGSLMNGDLFNGSYFNSFNSPNDASSYKNKIVNESNWLSEAEGVNNFMTGVEESIGFMLPSIVAGILTGGASTAAEAASLGTMGVGSFASGFNEVYNETQELDKALAVGGLKAAVEILTEKIPWPGGNLVNGINFEKVATKGFKSFASKIGKQMVEEGLEEVVSAVVEPFINEIYKKGSIEKAYGNTDNLMGFLFGVGDGYNFTESVAGQGLAGSVSGLLLSGTNQLITNKQIDNEITPEGRRVLVDFYKFVDVLGEYEKAAKKLTKENGGKLTQDKLVELESQFGGKLGEAATSFELEWKEVKPSLNEEQVKKLGEYISNPAQILDTKAERKEYESQVESNIRELGDVEKYEGIRSINKGNQLFNTDAKIGYVKDSEINDKALLEKKIGGKISNKNYQKFVQDGEAFTVTDNGRVIIKESMKDSFNRLTAHEYLGHVVLNSTSLAKKLRNNLVYSLKNNKEFYNAWEEAYKKQKDGKSFLDLYGVDNITATIDENGKVHGVSEYFEKLNDEQMAAFIEYIFNNESIFNTLDNLSQNSIRNFVRKTIEALKGVKNSDARSQARVELEKVLKRISRDNAKIVRKNAKQTLSQRATNETTGSGIQFSFAGMGMYLGLNAYVKIQDASGNTEKLSYQDVVNRFGGGNRLKNQNVVEIGYDVDGKEMPTDQLSKLTNKQRVELIEKSPMGAMLKETLDGERYKNQVKSLAEYTKLLSETSDAYLTQQFVGSMFFYPIRNNSDSQYSYTIDLEIVCKKTQAMVDAMSELMLEKKRGLTTDEIKELYAKQVMDGKLVPCPMCYVFSRWVGVGGILNNLNNFQKEYGNITEEEKTKILANIEKDVRKAYHIKPSEEVDSKTRARYISKYNNQYTKVMGDLQELERQGYEEYLANAKKSQQTKIKKAGSVEKYEQQLLKEKERLEDILRPFQAYTWLKEVQGKEPLVPDNVLWDLNAGDEFAMKYPLAWKWRTTRGPSAGKAIQPYADTKPFQIIEGLINERGRETAGRITDDSSKQSVLSSANGEHNRMEYDYKKVVKEYFELKNGRYLLSSNGQQLIEKAINAVRRQNLKGGTRLQSYSDLKEMNVSDYLMAFLELQMAHSKAQTYTKVLFAVPFFNSVNVCTNMSLMPSGIGYDAETNKLLFSNTTGILYDVAFKYLSDYKYAGTIMVGINDKHIELCLNDKRVSMVIPYHASGGRADLIASWLGSLRERADTSSYTSYEDSQEDVWLSSKKLTQEQKAYRELRNKILTKKGLTSEELKTIKADTQLNNLYNVLNTEENKDVKFKENDRIYPYEFWDTTADYDHSSVNSKNFLEYCNKLGVEPRFSQFADQPNYWKLLVDRKMYDYNTGEYLEQPYVSLDTLAQVNDRQLKQVVGADEKLAMERAAQFKSEAEQLKDYYNSQKSNQNNNISFSISGKDSEGNQLSKEQQEFFKDSKVRDEDGNLLVVYHGTNEDFTVFDRTKTRANMDIQGNFFSPYRIEAEGYGSKVGVYYLNITNPANEKQGYAALNKYKGQNNAGVKARDYLISQGYDGVIGYDEYIAFEPNQIKSINNTKPTDDVDIRFSFSSDYDLSQKELDEIDKMVDELLDIDDLESKEENNIKQQKDESFVVHNRTNGFLDPKYQDAEELKKFRLSGKTASFSEERVKDRYEYSMAKFDSDYAQEYLTYISPQEFLELTLPTRLSERDANGILSVNAENRFSEDNIGKLDTEELRKEHQPIYLEIENGTGNVKGHEGRHRMYALMNAGYTNVQIMVQFYNKDWHLIKNVKNVKVPSTLKGQEFRKGKATTLKIPFNTEDLVTLSEGNLDKALESAHKYEDNNLDLRFSIGDLEPQKQQLFANENTIKRSINSSETQQINDGDVINLDRPKTDEKRVYSGYAPTLTTHRRNYAFMVNGELRYLSPREFWRLMGFTDEQFAKVDKANKMTALYKQAGNSIVVPVLESIVKDLNLPQTVKLEEHFAGVGAIRQALINMGYDVKSTGVVEYDKNAVKSYNVLYGTDIKPTDVRDYVKNTKPHYSDIFLFGSPCVDNSSANAKGVRGFVRNTDTESAIFWDSFDYAKECKPKYIIWENVENVVKQSKLKATFDEVVKEIEELGYKVSYKVLDARNFGVPQARRRLIAIFSKYGKPIDISESNGKSMPNIMDYLGLNNDSDIRFSVSSNDNQATTNNDDLKPQNHNVTLVRNYGNWNKKEMLELAKSEQNIQTLINTMLEPTGRSDADYWIKANKYNISRALFEKANLSKSEADINAFLDNVVDYISNATVVHKEYLFDDEGKPILTSKGQQRYKLVNEQMALTEDQIKDIKDVFRSLVSGSMTESKISKLNKQFRTIRDNLKAEIIEQKNRGQYAKTFKGLKRSLPKTLKSDVEWSQDDALYHNLSLMAKPFLNLKSYRNSYKVGDLRTQIGDFLNNYTEENIKKNFEETSLVYDENIRAMYENLYNLLDGYTDVSLNAQQLKQINEILRAITKHSNDSIDERREVILPSARASKDMIDVYGKLPFRLTKKLAANFANIRRIFGYSEIGDILTNGYRRGKSNSVMFSGKYTAKIRDYLQNHKELEKQLPKKVKFHNVELMYDELIKIYNQLRTIGDLDVNSTDAETKRKISLTAFGAINDGGLSVWDKKTGKLVDIEGIKKNAINVREELKKMLPQEVIAYANFLFDMKNKELKRIYTDFFKKKYGVQEANVQDLYESIRREVVRVSNVENLVVAPRMFANEQTKKINDKPVIVESATYSTIDYVNQLADEMYLMPTMRKAYKILNTRYGNNSNETLVGFMNRKYGLDTIQYINEIMRRESGVDLRNNDKLFGKLMNNFYKSSLGLKWTASVKQTVSAFMSNYSVDKVFRGQMSRIFGSKEFKAEYQKLKGEIGALLFRSKSSRNLGLDLDNTFTSHLDNFTDKMMLPLSWGDKFAMNTGLLATMIAGQSMGYKIGTEEFRNFVLDNYIEYDLTQINSDVLGQNGLESFMGGIFNIFQGPARVALATIQQKLELAKRYWKADKSVFQSNLTDAQAKVKEYDNVVVTTQNHLEEKLGELSDLVDSYKQQGILKKEYQSKQEYIDLQEEIKSLKQQLRQAENNLISAKSDVVKWQTEIKNYERFQNAGGKLTHVSMASSLILLGIILTLINELDKRIRGKKDWDELDAQDILKQFGYNALVSWIPFVNTLTNSITNGYDVTIPSAEIVNGVTDTLSNTINLIKGETSDYKPIIRNAMSMASNLTGLPIKTIWDYSLGITSQFDPDMALKLKDLLYTTSPTYSTKAYNSYVESGNERKALSQLKYNSNRFKGGVTNDAINKELYALSKDGYNAIPKNIPTSYTDSEGNIINLTKEQINAFKTEYLKSLSVVDKTISDVRYQGYTSEQRAKILKKIYDSYYEYAKCKSLGVQPTSKLGQLLYYTDGNFNISRVVSILSVIQSITDTKNKTRKELVFNYINRLKGITAYEKLLILKLAGYSVTDQTRLESYLKRSGMSRKELVQFLQ